MKIREPLETFTQVCEARMRRYDETRGPRTWLRDSPQSLMARLVMELHEVFSEMRKGDDVQTSRVFDMLTANIPSGVEYDRDAVVNELADVANFCMMIADVLLTPDEEKEDLVVYGQMNNLDPKFIARRKTEPRLEEEPEAMYRELLPSEMESAEIAYGLLIEGHADKMVETFERIAASAHDEKSVHFHCSSIGKIERDRVADARVIEKRIAGEIAEARAEGKNAWGHPWRPSPVEWLKRHWEMIMDHRERAKKITGQDLRVADVVPPWIEQVEETRIRDLAVEEFRKRPGDDE